MDLVSVELVIAVALVLVAVATVAPLLAAMLIVLVLAVVLVALFMLVAAPFLAVAMCYLLALFLPQETLFRRLLPFPVLEAIVLALRYSGAPALLAIVALRKLPFQSV